VNLIIAGGNLLSFDLKNIEYTHPKKFSTIPSPDGEGGDEENLNKNLLGWVIQAFSITRFNKFGITTFAW
jgi:hypothetical protein